MCTAPATTTTTTTTAAAATAAAAAAAAAATREAGLRDADDLVKYERGGGADTRGHERDARGESERAHLLIMFIMFIMLS